jgi:hypothetical protein
MAYFKLNGQPVPDGEFDSGASGVSPQQGSGTPAPDAALNAGPASPSVAPGPEVLTFVSDDGTLSATDTPPPAVSTQTVTFAGSGIVFNNSYTGAVSAAYQNCVLSAEQQIASLWTNPVTINVEFDAQAAGTSSGFLASNQFWTVFESYSSLKSALTSLASTEPQNMVLQQAVAHLPTTDPTNGAGFELPLPYARILGLSASTRSPEDIVTLNTSFNWNYGQDVINTLEHEISEGGMGRVGGLGDQNSFWSTMDLFRYNLSGQPDYTDGRDGRTTFFSYNGGATLSTLSFNNEFNSRGIQVNKGDTADFTQQDVFGTGSPGETNVLSPTDIQVMEALGWTPPVTVTAEMVIRDASNNYFLYDIAQNLLQPSSTLGTLVPSIFGGIGSFGGDKGDLMLRGSNGDVYVYDISNNQIVGTHDLGNIGLDWAISGFGDFSGNPGETDMITRNSGTGQLWVYDISNNQVTFSTSLGIFASNTVAGFGDFSGNAGETDMMMRSSSGDFIVYDMGKNSVTSGPIDLGNVGLNWAVQGFGDFSSNSNETDMITRNTNNGDFFLYDISNNRVTGAKALGNVGLDWTLAGFGDFSGNPGETDMMLRNSSTGAFEVYDFANNQIYNFNGSTGQVTTSSSVVAIGPNDAGSDISLASSSNNGSASTDAGGLTLADFGAESQQVVPVDDFSQLVPPLDSLFQPSAAGWLDPVITGIGQTQPSAGVPPVSDFLSAPSPMAEFSSALSEPGAAAGQILVADPLQHTG